MKAFPYSYLAIRPFVSYFIYSKLTSPKSALKKCAAAFPGQLQLILFLRKCCNLIIFNGK